MGTRHGTEVRLHDQVVHWEGDVGHGVCLGHCLLWLLQLRDWTQVGGWKHKISKPATMPYEESYPKKNPRWERNEPHLYGAQGFDKNTIELKTSTTPYHS